jgi:hypothetical protein
MHWKRKIRLDYGEHIVISFDQQSPVFLRKVQTLLHLHPLATCLRKGDPMSATLYIDGLLASIPEPTLKGMFSQFGKVLTIETLKARTPQSVTVGKVEMEMREEAMKAARALHRSDLGGKLFLVFM